MQELKGYQIALYYKFQQIFAQQAKLCGFNSKMTVCLTYLNIQLLFCLLLSL